jgi:hypothetical protein
MGRERNGHTSDGSLCVRRTSLSFGPARTLFGGSDFTDFTARVDSIDGTFTLRYGHWGTSGL